jgi:peptidoglycan/LPS O-acetylase OafA/YrhL
MQGKGAKIYYLDGIRGLASAIVVIHHFSLAFLPAYYTRNPNDVHLGAWELSYGASIFSLLTNGNFAVCVFFVLSGYVLSRQYFLSGRQDVLVSASVRRFIRLYVPVAVTIVLAYALLKAGWYYNVPASHIAHSEWWMGKFWVTDRPEERLMTCLLHSTMFSGDAWFDTSMWTITIELYGSLLVFAFLGLTHDMRNRGLALLFLLLYFIWFQQYYYAAFILGIALNLTKHWEPRSAALRIVVPTLLVPVSFILAGQPINVLQLPDYFFPDLGGITGEPYHVAGSVMLIVAVLMSPRLQQAFSLKLFRFLGYISFSLYLLHVPVIGSVGCFTFLKLLGTTSYGNAVAGAFAMTIIVTVAAAYVMTKLIDDKGVQFSKYIYGRFFKKEGRPTTEPAH